MALEIRVPTLGESIVEATVGRWFKREGDRVDTGETLVELETDKVNVPVEANAAGVLERITHQEGDTVGPNEVLALLNTTDGATAGAALPAEAASLPAAQAGEENGHQPLATPMALKIATENNLDLSKVKGSGANGRITSEDVRSVIEQASLVAISPPAEPVAARAAAPPATKADAGAAAAPVRTPPVEPPSTATTGVTAAPSQRPAPASPLGPLTAALNRREEREPMSRLRQTIAERLTDVLKTAAMLTTFNEVDMSAVMEVRKRRRDAFKERYGVNLGFMSFFTKATVGALKAFPNLNAEIQGKEIVKKYYYDIGIAVGTEKGLVVPVVRDADRKTFAGIEKDIADLAQRAREGKLTIPEMLGGTFTITNGGVYGSLMSTPILNAPQVGILGMHKIQERPMVVDGQIVARPMMYLALSYDHRIVDGSEAVRFLVRIKELIEDPESLLLEG